MRLTGGKANRADRHPFGVEIFHGLHECFSPGSAIPCFHPVVFQGNVLHEPDAAIADLDRNDMIDAINDQAPVSLKSSIDIFNDLNH